MKLKKIMTFIVSLALVCGLLAGCSEGFGGGFEKAERAAFNSLTSEFILLMNTELTNISEKGNIKLTPAAGLYELMGMGGMEALIGSIGMEYDVVLDGEEMYMMFGADIMGISLQAMMWLVENELFMQIPAVTDYYITFGDLVNLGDSMSLAADLDAKKLEKETENLINRIADKYIELADGGQNIGKQEVTVGSVTKNCDVYQVNINETFAAELVKEAIYALIDSPTYMELMDASMASADPYGMLGSFEDMLKMAITELESEVSSSDSSDENIIMKVYVSGKDIIKREFTFEGVTASFAGIKGSEYAQECIVSDGDFTVSFFNKGSVKNKSFTGTIDASFKQDFMNYSAVINYTDCKLEKNDMFSGKIELVVPNMVSANIDASVSGDTQNLSGGVSVMGTHILDIELSSTVETGRKVTKPAISGNNVLDISNYEDMAILEDLFEDFADSLGLDSILGVLGMGGYGHYDDWGYDWDDYDWDDEDWDW